MAKSFLIALAAMVAILCGCSAKPQGSSASAALRIAQQQEPASLDPLLLNGTVGNETAALIYSYLVKFDDRGNLVPDIALVVPSLANGGISGDGRLIRYRIRHGVRFSDGVEVTAKDVLFTQSAVMNGKNLIQSRLGYDQVSAITAPDRYTVLVRLKRPYAPFLALFCAPGNVYPVMPDHLLARYADLNRVEFNTAPIGSGPYTVLEWRRGDRIVLQANKHYWKGTPRIQTIELRFTPDYNAMVNRLSSGDVDAVFNADSSIAAELRGVPSVNVKLTPIDGQGAFIFNMQDPITRQEPVRRALGMAIDAKAMVVKASQRIYTNHDAGRGMLQWAYNPRLLQMPAYDPPAARRLLEEGGWKLGADGIRRKNGRSLDVLYIESKGAQATAIIGNAVQEYERAIGVNLSQKEFAIEQFANPAQLGGPVYGGKFQMAFYPFLPGEDPDVTDQFACNRIPPEGFNKPRFCDPKMDAALARGIASFDRTKRQAAYDEVQRILSKQLPMLFIYQIVQVNAFPKWLKHQTGAVTTPFWNVAAWSR
ncbi:MAG: peptide ABC transporter substrate-binding protein [Candidatus Eremiobacteraeota bacterium]|nr:peptide ABC transporter substrate-binding protein [Candidatus Eremiobacteraeota bacterium]